MRKMTTNATLLAIVFNSATLLAQPATPLKEPASVAIEAVPAKKEGPKKPVPGSLEDLLETALQHNADIKWAEAKVRVSEAELNHTRQQIFGRISALHLEVQAHKESLKVFQDGLRLDEIAAKQGATPLATLNIARANLAKAQIDLAKVEGELQSLVGGREKNQVRGLAFTQDGRLLTEWLLNSKNAQVGWYTELQKGLMPGGSGIDFAYPLEYYLHPNRSATDGGSYSQNAGSDREDY